MKKIVMSLAGLLAAAAFAPEASALPVFSRQTGMACQACHFQHFPQLNAFGRAFKASGFTLVGPQGKVEAEELSYPTNLNMAVLATAGYQKTTGTAPGAVAPGKNTQDGLFFVPGNGGELSLFFGGRIAEFGGFLAELSAPVTEGAQTASAKLPLLWEVGGSGNRVGLVPFTGEQGAAHGFELLNTGAVAVHKLMGEGGDIDTFAPDGATRTTNHEVNTSAFSAAQYLGTKHPATGVSFVAVNPNMGYVNVTPFMPTTVDNGGSMKSLYARAVAMFNMAGWDSAVGVQNWSGSAYANGIETVNVVGGAPVALGSGDAVDTRATVIDAQMQHELMGKPVGIYASYGYAPSVASAGGGTITAGASNNLYNNLGLATATGKRSSFNIAAELGVIPHKATVMAAIRVAKSGVEQVGGVGTPGANNLTDNAFLLGATYELAQNVELSLIHTRQSGGYWDPANWLPPVDPTTQGSVGKTLTTFGVDALF